MNKSNLFILILIFSLSCSSKEKIVYKDIKYKYLIQTDSGFIEADTNFLRENQHYKNTFISKDARILKKESISDNIDKKNMKNNKFDDLQYIGIKEIKCGLNNKNEMIGDRPLVSYNNYSSNSFCFECIYCNKVHLFQNSGTPINEIRLPCNNKLIEIKYK